MRYCPSCGTRFSGEVRFCPHDGQPLAELDQEITTETVDPLIGQTLDGRYRVEEILGEGGMGIVYRCVHAALNKPFALKVLHGDMAKDGNVVQRFIQEAQSSSAIGHPNIIDISDFGKLPDGTAYFVMEYLEGESLSDRMTRAPLSMEEAADIAGQVASALAAAHARGIVHRDLKPDNIFLIERGGSPRFVKVLDFGIAKVGGANSKLTKTGMVFGTPHYMSPEQAAGQSVDARADVYAVGVILYEMLTGEVPYDADTFMGILSKHMFDPLPTLDQSQPTGRFQGVVARALAKKPEERYPSMEAFRSDLNDAKEGETIPPPPGPIAPPVMALEGFPTEPTRIDDPPRMSDPVELPSNRRPLLMLGLVLAALGLAGLGAAVNMLRGGPESGPPEPTLTARSPEASAMVVADMSATSGMTLSPSDVESMRASSMEAAVAPAMAAEMAMVAIESEPEGAEVFMEGALVGRTPTRLPRPSGSTRITVELRAEGYEPREIGLFSYSPEVIHASLDRRRRTSGVRMSTRMSSMTISTMTESTPMTTPPPTMMSTMHSSEVLNPWAN